MPDESHRKLRYQLEQSRHELGGAQRDARAFLEALETLLRSMDALEHELEAGSVDAAHLNATSRAIDALFGRTRAPAEIKDGLKTTQELRAILQKTILTLGQKK